jgi:hypothetical protein
VRRTSSAAQCLRPVAHYDDVADGEGDGSDRPRGWPAMLLLGAFELLMTRSASRGRARSLTLRFDPDRVLRGR